MMAIAVTTRAYDATRSGANTRETVLSPAAVEARGIRRLFSLATPGDRRGVEAQPLVVPGVRTPDGSTHEIVYLADMANQVWAFDAGDGSLLWKRTLGRPVDGTSTISGHPIDNYSINDHWGVLSTPVIDPGMRTMYLVAWVSPDGTAQAAQHLLYAIDIRDGSTIGDPIDLDVATYAPGHGLPIQRFQSAVRKQRASLLLTSIHGVTTVFIAFGTLVESSGTARGWLIACNSSPLRYSAAWTATARGDASGTFGGGIWQAGAGLAADDAGFVYLMTGNGNFDAVTDWGESFVKLRYTPPTAGAVGSLEVADWWTPWTDAARVGAGGMRDSRPHATNFRPYDLAAADGWSDMDLGSGGPVVIPDHAVVVGAGKDGVLYVVKQASMGRTTLADLQNPRDNYKKLKSWPILFTYFDPAVNPAPDDVTALNVFAANQTHHLHGNPIYWHSPDLGPLLYCWGENGNLRAWSLAADGSVHYLACGAEQASAESPVGLGGGPPHGGMPGGMLTLSADATRQHSGVVWALIPYGNANTEVTPGRLLAYDATQFGTFADGSSQLRVLWDSQRWANTFNFNKFNPPVVANGRLYVPTYDARVDVYGLA